MRDAQSLPNVPLFLPVNCNISPGMNQLLASRVPASGAISVLALYAVTIYALRKYRVKSSALMSIMAVLGILTRLLVRSDLPFKSVRMLVRLVAANFFETAILLAVLLSFSLSLKEGPLPPFGTRSRNGHQEVSPATMLSYDARGRTKRRRPRRQRSVSISSASSEDIPLVVISRRGKGAKAPGFNDRARAPRHDSASATRSDASPTRDLEDAHPSTPRMSYDDFRAQIRGMHGQHESSRAHAPTREATRGVRFEESVLTFATRREGYYYEPDSRSSPLFSTPERPVASVRQQHRQHIETDHRQTSSPMYAALAQALRDGHGSPEPADELSVPNAAVSPPPPPPLVPTPVFHHSPVQVAPPLAHEHSPGPQLSPVPLSPVLPSSPIPPPAVPHRPTNVHTEHRPYTSHPTRSSPELMDVDLEEMEVDEVDDSMHIDTSQDDDSLPASPSLEPAAVDRTLSGRSFMDTAETPEMATVALEPDEEDEDAIDRAIDLDMQDRLAQRAQAQAAVRRNIVEQTQPEVIAVAKATPVVGLVSRVQPSSSPHTPTHASAHTVGRTRPTLYASTSFVTAGGFGSPLRKHQTPATSKQGSLADRGSAAKQIHRVPHHTGSPVYRSSEDRTQFPTLEQLRLRADKLTSPEIFDEEPTARSSSPGHTCKFTHHHGQESSPWCRCAARTFAHAREARKGASPMFERPPANAQNNRARARH